MLGGTSKLPNASFKHEMEGTMLRERQIQALKLVRGMRGANLTHYGNTLVSRQAKSLLAAGLISYGEGPIAYVLTQAGERELSAVCQTPGCFGYLPCPDHGGE